MIFREKESSSDKLPLIQSAKKDVKEEPKIETAKSEQIQTHMQTETINSTHSNNRYANKEINNDIQNLTDDKISQQNPDTIHSSRALTEGKKCIQLRHIPYISKVELQYIRSVKDCIYLLEEYLKSNNIQCNYETQSDQDTITFLFDDEKAAMGFTKIIYAEKIKNALYKNVILHFRLIPNQVYLRSINLEKNQKRGLSYESIMKLYKGNSYVKQEKKIPKNLGYLNNGILPFFDSNENRFKLIKKNIINNKNKHNLFVGYDGKPLKSYQKLRINVLDTHYNPIFNHKIREENKSKWLSPYSFKFY